MKAAKFADGVVIWVGIASEKAYGDVAMGGPFDLTGREEAVGVAVD